MPGSEAGRGICEADDSVVLGEGDERGRPNAPPKVGAGADEVVVDGAPNRGPPPLLGSVDEWAGFEGRADLRYDSVRSGMSEVSSCIVS